MSATMAVLLLGAGPRYASTRSRVYTLAAALVKREVARAGYTAPVKPLPPDLADHLKRDGAGVTVLVVRLGALGDILRTLPALRELRGGLPHARVLWVVDERWGAVLRGHGDLDGTVEVPRRDWARRLHSPAGWPALLRSVLDLRSRLRGLRAGLLLDFHANLRSGVIGWLSGAPVRLGYDGHQQKEGNRLFNTHRVEAGARRRSRVERNLDLVRALGVVVRAPAPVELPLVATGRTAAAQLLRGLDRPFAVIAPGASKAQAFKKPPARLLAAGARRLARHGIAPLVVWGPGEEPDAARVVEDAGGAAALAPPTDLPALAALLARAAVFVGGDSGPLHLACAVGCPVIGLYGPTDPVVNGPWGVPSCSVAPPGRRYTGVKRSDRRAGGFEGLEPSHVGQAVDELLETLAHRPAALHPFQPRR
jgi:ADP-heptose:LPS heptosyltransferase